jgi:large subunit ribosomal protein L17
MRHLKAHRKLGRTTEHRISMLRNMATSLITSEKGYIVTTVPKAKELRPFVEKVITLARRAKNLSGDTAKAQEVHLRRQAARFFHAGNSTFKAEQSRFRGAKGTTKEPIERTAGVKAVQFLFDELGARYKIVTAVIRELSSSVVGRATMRKWRLSNWLIIRAS